MFKVGDLVTGIDGSHYGITNSNAVMKVIQTVRDCMEVLLISTEDPERQRHVGASFSVYMKFFKLVPPPVLENI